jgi:hypothetical protein
MPATRGVVAVAAVLASLSVVGSARAYCRTTTIRPPLGYDPTVNGCWTEGVPLAWALGRVPYGVATGASRQVSLADATRIADASFASWNDTLCTGGSVGIEAFDDGPITSVPDGSDLQADGTDASVLAIWGMCADSAACDPRVHDVLVFDDDRWPYDDPTSTLALTTVSYGLDDGRIFQAYTEINSAQNKLTTEEPPPANGDAFDLQAILTHEAGHFLGLAHSADPNAIMFATYKAGSIHLAPDDEEAICTVYPHVTDSPSSGGCAAAPSAPESWPPWSLVSLGALVAVARHRRRF